MTDKERTLPFYGKCTAFTAGRTQRTCIWGFRQTGALVQTALKGYRRIVLLINSASEFMEAVEMKILM